MSSDKFNTFDDLFQIGLEYMYDAEKQLTQALPKMAQAATSPHLRQAFESHLQETKTHVERLEQVFAKLGVRPQAKPNTVLKAMIQEGEGMIQNSEPSVLRDAALILAGNHVEHFEIGSYGSLCSFAERLGHDEIMLLLEHTLHDEKNADHVLTQIGEIEVNPQASQLRTQLTSN